MQLQTLLIAALIFIVVAVMGIIIFLPTQTPTAPITISTPIPVVIPTQIPTIPIPIPTTVVQETQAANPNATRRRIAPQRILPPGRTVTGPDQSPSYPSIQKQ